jgi:uncharacterized CHY-type Zn-finger protein
MKSSNTRVIGDVTVIGIDVDPETRCAHYHGHRDIIAINSSAAADGFRVTPAMQNLPVTRLKFGQRRNSTRLPFSAAPARIS